MLGGSRLAEGLWHHRRMEGAHPVHHGSLAGHGGLTEGHEVLGGYAGVRVDPKQVVVQ